MQDLTAKNNLHDPQGSHAAPDPLRSELQRELDRTPGLADAIRSLHETGSCAAAPPVFAALHRLGLHGSDVRLQRAYQLLS